MKSKLSADHVNLPTISRSRVPKKASKSTIDSVNEEGYFLDDVEVIKKITAVKKVKAVKKKERFDGVEPATSRSSSSVKTVTRTEKFIELTEELSAVSIADTAFKPDHAADYTRLLASTTITSEHDFESFLTSPAVVSLLPEDQGSSGPTFRKIGEASYSEVFAMPTREGRDIVVKVIPLFDYRRSESTGRPEKMPDTSYPGDVLRELEITSRMSEMPGGGFIDCLG